MLSINVALVKQRDIILACEVYKRSSEVSSIDHHLIWSSDHPLISIIYKALHHVGGEEPLFLYLLFASKRSLALSSILHATRAPHYPTLYYIWQQRQPAFLNT